MTPNAENDALGTCPECCHTVTRNGCTGDPTPSDLWAGVSPAACDCPCPIPPVERATGAIVPERQRCICNDGLCLDHCRACNHSGRDLEEPCIADPDWTPDDDDLARREARVLPPGKD